MTRGSSERRRRKASDGAEGPALDNALRVAVDQDAILKALAQAVHYGRGGDPEVPTEADLIDFLSECPEAEREKADLRLTKTLGIPARWTVRPVAALSKMPPSPPTLQGLVVLRLANELGETDVWEYLGENMLTVHVAWRDRLNLKHPLAPIVRAWQVRPRPVAKRHVISIQDGNSNEPPLNRAPAVADYALLSPVEAVMVDGEPLVSGGPDAVRWWCRREPAPGDQRLLFAGPRKLNGEVVADVVIKACVSMGTWDHRKPLLGDVLRVASLAFGLTSYGPIPEDLGAVFVGGRDTVANRKRWWASARFLRTLDVTINDRTGEFVGLAHVDPDGVGGVHLGPPAWWRGKGDWNHWRLSGALWRPARIGDRRRGAGGQDELYSGLARTLAGFESRLSYSPTAGLGQHGRIPDALRPVRPGGPGPQVFVHWRDSVTLSGEYVAPDADATGVEGRRYRRRIDALEAAKYFVKASGAAAQAGDTVEIVKVQRGWPGTSGGVWIRASARYCEAAVEAKRRDRWTRLPAARLLVDGARR